MNKAQGRTQSRFVVVALVALLALGAWFWKGNFKQQSTLERLLTALPERQAVIAYVDVPALRRAPKLGPWVDAMLAKQDDKLPLATGIRGLSIALGEESIYLATALDLTEAAAVSYLAQQRAGCAQPLDEAACTTSSSSGGHLSMRLLKENLLAIAHSSDPTAADRLDGAQEPKEEAAKDAQAAIGGGALLWARLDPQRLDEVMRNPPEGWVNLSLVARALGPAQSASITAREVEDGVKVELNAECANAADAQELSSVLAGLNKMAGGLLAAESNDSPWKSVVKGFKAKAQDSKMTAEWTIPAVALEVHP